MNLKKHRLVIAFFVCVFFFYAFFNVTFSIYREIKEDSINLSILDPNSNYVVTFNANGGTSVPSITRTYNQPVGTLPTTTQTNYNFMGWYTDPTGGTKISSTTPITGTTTFYAHWEEIVCKKATTLHTETCSTGGGCLSSGHAINSTITYGTIPDVYSPVTGDAYDCDVNGDGIYDAATERFYYVRNVEETVSGDTVDNAVLVHFTSFDELGQADNSTSREIYYFDDGKTWLPSSTMWSNSKLKTFDGKPTRYINEDDLTAACGTFVHDTNNYLDTCEFFLENSRFQSSSLGRSGIWIDKIENDYYRIDTRYSKVTLMDSTSRNSVRPVIQIPAVNLEDYKERVAFTITFDSDGGSSVSPIERYEGQKLGTLETPTKTGFHFAGWFTNKQYTTEVTSETVVTGTAIYYAKWVGDVTVTFNANGVGATVSPNTVTIAEGSTISDMPIPTYAGHEFLGWFTDSTNGTEVTLNTPINDDITLYAHWSLVEDLQYVFYIPGECSFTSSGLANGTNGNCISTINPTGTEIDYTQGSLSTKKYIDTQVALYDTINHDKDYEIGFTIVSYSPSNQVDNGTLMNTKGEINTTDVKYPGVVFRRNKSTDNFLIQSRQTLSTNAEYSVASSTVESVKIYRIDNEIFYSINGAPKVLLNNLTAFNPVFDLNVWFGAAPKNATATQAQRYFIGTLSDMYIKVEPDAIETVDVTFDPNYTGAQTTTQEMVKGNALGTLPTPDARVGYTFLGWFTDPTDGTEVTSSTVVNDDVTYYAHWVQNVTITLNPGDGTVTPNTITLTSGSTVGNLLPTPEYTGHTFVGWYEESTYDTLVTSETVVTSDTTFYAKWANSVTITLNAHGGTVTPNTVTLAQGGTVGDSLPTPEYTGHTFDGWYEDSGYNTPVTSSTVVTTDTEFHAKWIENITITLDPGDGTVTPNTISLAPGSAVGTLPTPELEDYIFDGWYEESTYDTLVTSETTVSTNTTFYAKWEFIDYEAQIGEQKYETLAEAVADVPTTGVKTTITILKDIDLTSSVVIPNTKNVEIVGGSYTITNDTNAIFTNNGTLTLKSGTFTTSGTERNKGHSVDNQSNATLNIEGGTYSSTQTCVLINSGNINITGGRLEGKGQSAVINNNAGILNVSGGELIGTFATKGQAIYNAGGTTNISGTAYLENNSQTGTQYGRACVHNFSGTVNITGGTIVSKKNAAVKNNGTMTIGTNDESIDTTSPVLQGNNYGLEIVSGYPVTIYDGIFKGGAGSNPKKAINDETLTSHGTTVITHDTETISGVVYDVAYLVDPSVNYTVTFNPNGGSIKAGDPNTKTYTDVDVVGQMPSATKADTEFLGWFTSATGGERVLTTTVVDDDATYYAHYTSQVTVCRPATTLHSSGGTDFGQIPSGGSLSAGDAYDCDVNGDGTYDATNERFYYLTDSSDGNAVFIFSNNTSQVNNNATAVCSATAVAYGTGGPNTAIGELPTIAQWPNVNIYTEPRNITNEAGTTVQANYEYTAKAARFATLDEIKAATSSSINGTVNELASYTFLLENTPSYDATCRSNYWLETNYSEGGVYRINGATNGKNLGHATGNSGVRAVIEVPYSSIDGVVNIVQFDTIPEAMRVYFNNVATWNAGQSDANYSSFNSAMTTNLNNYNCAYYLNDNTGTQYGSVFCDQPNKYDTGQTGNINVYEYDESTNTVSNSQATYVFNDNGKLYNFIPGKVYYWESATDSSKHGYVRPTGERRLITIPGTTRQTRNVRDLGGLPVDTNNDGTIDGTVKYQKIYRGEKIWGTNRNGVTRAQLEQLGIYNELDLRASNENTPSEEDQLSNYISNEIIHYKIDYDTFGPNSSSTVNGKSYYEAARDAAIDVMQRVVEGNDDYAIYFHCRVGADRTGTLAYLLEGALGVPTEYRHQDYELTTFFGLRERTRYYFRKDSTNDEYKFIYLKKAIRHATPNNDEITGEENVMDWFLLDGNTTNECSDITALINQFRAKMIDYNS